MTQCCIALGANLGDPAQQFELALSALKKAGNKVLRTSRNYITPAMGSEAGCDFHNAAAVLDTPLPAEKFLQQLHDIEAMLGRQRTIVWGPRSLDLDLLLYNDEVVQTASLVVPHPLLWFRRFVLAPLCEVAPDWVHPTLGESVSQLLERLNTRPIIIEIDGDSVDESMIDAIQESLKLNFQPGCIELTNRRTENQFATVKTDSEPKFHASQPNLETARIVRKPADGDIEVFLQDILTAALPHNQLIKQR